MAVELSDTVQWRNDQIASFLSAKAKLGTFQYHRADNTFSQVLKNYCILMKISGTSVMIRGYDRPQMELVHTTHRKIVQRCYVLRTATKCTGLKQTKLALVENKSIFAAL